MSSKRAKKRVVVAMSGGVDSSVTAALMARDGHEVIGLTMQLYDHGEAGNRKGACCAGQDIYDAKQVAEKLGIAHYVLNYEDLFKKSVMQEFAGSYREGETPIPCVLCNQTVKFRDMLGTARDLGADFMATGHYVRRDDSTGHPRLLKGEDESRDQSYFLFATTREQLDFLRFPLGNLQKREVREIAASLGLSVAEKPDSQDICFVPTGRYASVVERLKPGSLTPGDIVHLDGRVLGKHNGIINYTVGQRKGLGISASEPLYVIKLDATNNKVIAGPWEALAKQEARASRFNWLIETPATPIEVQVKCRSTTKPVTATLHAGHSGTARAVFHEPQHGIAPGQALVAYAGDELIGGGWIIHDLPHHNSAGLHA